MSVLKVKNGDQWDIVPAIKGDTGDPAADESITDAMLVPDGIKTEIDWLWGNQLMDIREGELLQTDDAYEAPLVSLDVDGESTQVTTTGKNLFTKEGESAGYINGAGTAVGGNGWMRSTYLPITGGLTYTFNPNSTAGASAKCAFYDTNKNVISGAVFASGLNTFDAPNDAEWIRVSYRRDTSYDIQLEIGSEATSYEPYSGGAASPRPDWPQEIKSVDAPSLEFRGVNLLDPTRYLIANNQNLLAPNSDNYVEIDNDSIKFVHNNTLNGLDLYLGKLPEGTYRYSMGSGMSPNSVLVYLVKYPNGFNVGTNVRSVIGTIQIANPIIISEAGYYGLCAYVANQETYVLPQMQFTYGSTIPQFAGYQTSCTVPLLPDGYSLRSLPNGTKDELHLSYLRPSTREGWAWYNRELVQRIYELLVNYATNVGSNAGGPFTRVYLPRTGINTTSAYDNVLCDHFSCGPASIQGDCLITSNGGVAIFSGAMFDTIENARAWMAENVPVFDYPLATPITTQLDPIELPIMPSKDTTIWSDPSAQLKVTYIQDTNLVIESLEATVADMATS